MRFPNLHFRKSVFSPLRVLALSSISRIQVYVKNKIKNKEKKNFFRFFFPVPETQVDFVTREGNGPPGVTLGAKCHW